MGRRPTCVTKVEDHQTASSPPGCQTVLRSFFSHESQGVLGFTQNEFVFISIRGKTLLHHCNLTPPLHTSLAVSISPASVWHLSMSNHVAIILLRQLTSHANMINPVSIDRIKCSLVLNQLHLHIPMPSPDVWHKPGLGKPWPMGS